MRRVSTRVLPEPGPAKTKTGPLTVCTALACCRFNPSSVFSIIFVSPALFYVSPAMFHLQCLIWVISLILRRGAAVNSCRIVLLQSFQLQRRCAQHIPAHGHAYNSDNGNRG